MTNIIQHFLKIKYKIVALLSALLITLFSCAPTYNVYAQSYTTATGTTTGSSVCSLSYVACSTENHRVMGSGWSDEELSFARTYSNYNWMSALQAESSSITSKSGTYITPAIYYFNVKDSLYKASGSTGVLTINDVHGIIGNNDYDETYTTSKYNIKYTAEQVEVNGDYYFDYSLVPSSTGIGANSNTIYMLAAGSDIAYNNSYYESTDAAVEALLNGKANSTVKHKTIGTFNSDVLTTVTFTDTLPTLYYNPDYDIFEGFKTVTKTSAITYNSEKYNITRNIYVRAIFLRGGSSSTWISGFNSPGSLYNPETGLGRTKYGVVNQLELYQNLFGSDQYSWADGGNGETPTAAYATWVQPDNANPEYGTIVTTHYPSPLYGTTTLAQNLRKYDAYYKGDSDVAGYHCNSLILYLNVYKTKISDNSSELETYIIFYKDGDYIKISNSSGKLIIEKNIIINGQNILCYTLSGGSPPISTINYYSTFGSSLPYGLETIELLPHIFQTYDEDGLPYEYWTAYEGAYNAYTTDKEYYVNIYATAIGFNYLNQSSMYNASEGYTMLDMFWPGASTSESAGCESVDINNYGKLTNGYPNVEGVYNVENDISIYGEESYNSFDSSQFEIFASSLTELDSQIDAYSAQMQDYIEEYTNFLQSDYPLLSNNAFMATASTMKNWTDTLLNNSYISPFIDTVLLILIVMIAIR